MIVLAKFCEFNQTCFPLLEIFKAHKFGMAFSGFLLEALGILGGFDFWSHSVIPVHLKSGIHKPTSEISWDSKLGKKYNFLALIIMACYTNFLRIVIGSFLKVCLFCDWRLLQTALCFSSMHAMLFFFVYTV